jgi:hypothetical protein
MIGGCMSIDQSVVFDFNAPTIEDASPSEYRMARYPSGELVLQGKFNWRKGHAYGHNWKNLPIVSVDYDGNVIR